MKKEAPSIFDIWTKIERSRMGDLRSETSDDEKEELTAEARHMERVMLGLRTNQGVAIEDIDITKTEAYLQQGWLRQEGNRVIATTQGFHVLNRIIEDLV